MAQQINVDIVVKNKRINPFSTLTITQQVNGHHFFELRFNHDIFEEHNSLLINKSKEFLGEAITITLSTKYDSGYPDNIFKGIVTEISIANDINSAGDLIFKGYSPTILMEGGGHMASYLEKNLSQIIKTATDGIPGNVMGVNINPVYKSTVPYVVQQKESNFEFARRLAAEYGEWYFYDGTKFNFGKPANVPHIELTYPRDITQLNMQVRLAPSNFEQTGYYHKDDKKFASDSSSIKAQGLDSFGDHAMTVSDKLYNKPMNNLSLRPVQNKSELDSIVGFKRSGQAARMVYLVAASDSPYVRLGGTVSVSGLKPDKSSPEDFGKYTITSVVHTTDGLGNYTNIFEGIPASLKVLPNQYGNKPLAEPQLAVVKDLNDPDKTGKVKVQFLWQKNADTTPFIRVMMPHAGMRNNDKKNRGAFFTPEVGDYVIVGFAQNDPDRPFVMGSVPHGKAINTSMNSDNNAKAIRTRSGNTIYFFDNEKKNEQEIKIETDDKNFISILLKSGKGTIQIHSNDTIDVKSDKIVNVTSNNINVKAAENIVLEAGSNISIKAKKKIEIKAMEMTMDATQSLKANSMQVAVEGSVSAKVKGTQLDLEGAAMANLKAALVKIN